MHVPPSRGRGRKIPKTIETGTQGRRRVADSPPSVCMPQHPARQRQCLHYPLHRGSRQGSWPRPRLAHRRRQHRQQGRRHCRNCGHARRRAIVAVSDDGKTHRHRQNWRDRLWTTCRSLDLLPVIEHAEDVSLCGWRRHARRHRLHAVWGFPGCPPPQNPSALARDVQNRGAYRRRVSILHTYRQKLLSNKSASPRSKACASPAKFTPHHFTLIDEDVTYDSRFKMNPPLRRSRRS